MRLLFVDDSADRLDRLETGLTDLKPNWRIACVEDAGEAAAVMAAHAVDAVVVASSRGGRIVGDILRRAREVVPGAMRIAMAASEADAQVLLKADVAHRVATVQIRADWLVRVLEGVRKLESMLDDEDLRKRISSLERLPAMPGVALALMRENADGSGSMESIAKRLRGESAITAKILQLSNTAYYSRGTPILDVERALTRLGMDTVINLVLAAESFGAGAGAGRADLQGRAVLASQIATHVLRRLKKDVACSTAATAATLADIGLLLPLRGSFARRRSADDGEDFDLDGPPLESIAGAYLLSLWGLPWPIIEAVAFRHRPAHSTEDDFGVTAAVHTACALANGEPLDEALLESLDAMHEVPHWEAEALRLGAPARPAETLEF